MREYYDELKDTDDTIKNDADIARKLGVSPQTLYQTGEPGRALADKHAAKLAELLDRHPLELLCYVHAKRTKNTELEKIWLGGVKEFQAS